MAKSGSEIFEKYRNRVSVAGEEIRNGVLNTSKDQAENAIKAKDRMKANYNKSIDDGKYEKGLRDAGHSKWQQGMVNKGIPRMAQGIDANKSEIIQKFEKVGAVGEKVRMATENMSKGTVEDSIARVRKAMEIQKAEWNK